MKTFKIYTLGCKVNTYESEVMRDNLINNGYTEGNIPVDIAIINTCSVTNTADSKSMKTIRKAIKDNPEALIIVAGCMSQNKKENIAGVNIIIGNKYKSNIVSLINEYQGKTINKIEDIMNTSFESMRINNSVKTRAFIKIEDGCENFCSFCIIPYTRGNVRCKPKEDVLTEISDLINKGHKEIVLTGIHTGHYNIGNYTFSDLLEDILKIDGLERLRISSIEITELDDKFLKLLENSSILVDHMHIPLQSGSNNVLKQMNRKYDKEYFINKIEKIRKIRPNISLTTDVIVGFPGETDMEHQESIETIKKINFSKIHVFPYSDRIGTKASTMPNHINEAIKKERVNDLLKLSQELEEKYMNKFLDNDIVFIPEVYKDGYIIGHTGNYLLVKTLGNEMDLNKDTLVHLKCVNYPYIMAEKID